MFGTKTKQAETANEQYQRTRAEIDAAVATAMSSLAAEREAIEAEQKKAWEDDRDAFRFECSRMGDFLQFSITRLNTVRPNVLDADQRTLRPVTVTSQVNLSLVHEISLTQGAPAGRLEPVLFSMGYKSKSGGSASSSPLGPAPDGWTMTAYPRRQVRPSNYHESWEGPQPPASNSSHGWGGNSYYGNESAYSKEPFPMSASDDVVRLVGLGASFHCPFGSGQMVVDKVMAAIKAGAA